MPVDELTSGELNTESTPVVEAPIVPPVPQGPNYQELMARQEQEYMQRLQQAAQMNQQYEQALWQMQLNALPEEQKEAAKAWYEYQRQFQGVVNDLQRERAYREQLEQSVLPLVKREVFGKMSQEKQVERDLLERFAKSPADAELIAQVVKELRQKQVLEQRKTANVDSTPAAAPVSSSSKGTDELKNKYRNSGKLGDYIRARMASGW